MSTQEIILSGRYKLPTQSHASGGMAVVYKAQDMQLRRTVAIKVLRPSLTSDPSFLARFQQEAQNVANLSHPNIVTVHDFQRDGNTYYIVMEWVEGQDLKKIIRAGAPLPLERCLTIGIQICAGIGYAHRAGLVHADVKPQNMLITAEDIVKVTDFGIAQALSATQPQQKAAVVWGSPHYFAPEQASGELPTPASDVYSIGIVMFEMLTGKLPYGGADQQELAMAHIRDAVPHAMDFNPRIPVHLDRIIYKVMAKNPKERYATGDQLGAILKSYRQTGNENTIDQPKASPPPAFPVPGLNNTPGTGSRPASAGFTPSSQAFSSNPNPAGVAPRTGNTPPPSQPVSTPAPSAPYSSPYAPPQQQGNQQSQPQPQPQPQPYSQQPQAYSQQQAYNQQPAYNNSPQRQPTGSSKPIYTPPQPYNSAMPYAAAPDANLPAPNYQISQTPSSVDLVTVVLGIIAVLAFLGLIPLWLAVLGAYARV